MNRIVAAAIAAALLVGAIGLASIQPVSAQPGGPSVCLSLPPGDHTFTAPSQDREGEVSFTVSVGEGGVVTGFTEPGGQSIPPAAMLEIFTGEDAYPLPEGVSFIDCPEPDDSMMEDDSMDSAGICVNLDAGSHSGTVRAGGQSYEITIYVGDNNQVTSVDVLGQSYNPQDAMGLLESFGATLPRGVEIIPCPAPTDDSMTEDDQDHGRAVYPATGTGGLADGGDNGGMWAAIATVPVLVLTIATVARRKLFN